MFAGRQRKECRRLHSRRSEFDSTELSREDELLSELEPLLPPPLRSDPRPGLFFFGGAELRDLGFAALSSSLSSVVRSRLAWGRGRVNWGVILGDGRGTQVTDKRG